MYVVVTRGRLRPGTYKKCAELFQTSSPTLIANEEDFVDAKMIFDPATDIVSVLATWKNVDSYRRMRDSSDYKDALQAFDPYFAGPLDVSLNKVLVVTTS